MKNKSSETEKFDSLRAGLRVEDVDFKDAYTPKLIDRENAYWRRILDAMEEDVNSDRALSNQLRLRRRQVISGQYRKPGSGLPRFALGAAAGVAALAFAGAWWDQLPGGPGLELTRTASIESMEVDTAEFANNIDFYTWLEKQSDTVADSGGG